MESERRTSKSRISRILKISLDRAVSVLLNNRIQKCRILLLVLMMTVLDIRAVTRMTIMFLLKVLKNWELTTLSTTVEILTDIIEMKLVKTRKH